MCNRYSCAVLLAALFALPALGQGPRQPAAPEVTVENSPDAAAVMDLSQKIEDATVRGDAAYASGVTSSDFAMIHGDGWTTGKNPLAVNDKQAFLKRISDKEYLVHDLDRASIHFEMHGNVAITYGRYVSLFEPKNRNTSNPGRLNSIWFERVYAKRDGQWIYLSHRTVHGPTVSPAGADPSAVTTIAIDLQGEGISRTGFLSLGPRPAAGPRGSAGPGNGSGRPGSTPAGLRGVEEPGDTSQDAQDVLALEKKLAAEVVNGDVASVGSCLSGDFMMTHGDDWVRGGKPLLTDTKDSFLTKRVAVKEYLARDIATSKVEMHGDVAITYGQYIARLRNPIRPGQDWFSVWYERVWEKQNGKWMFLSHRTVHGPTYGPDRASVSDK